MVLPCWNLGRVDIESFATASTRPIGPSAESTVSANLLRFRVRVQRLLVRLIFLLGLSEGNDPISQFRFHLTNRFAVAERWFVKNCSHQLVAALSVLSVGTWTETRVQCDYAPATRMGSRDLYVGTFHRTGARSNFGAQWAFSVGFTRKLLGRDPQFIWSQWHFRLLFLPGI
jgi:hypothetical protein